MYISYLFCIINYPQTWPLKVANIYLTASARVLPGVGELGAGARSPGAAGAARP